MTRRVLAIDRFLFPTEAREAERYLLDALWPPHGITERLARSLRRVAGGRWSRSLIQNLDRAPAGSVGREVDALERVLAELRWKILDAGCRDALAALGKDPARWTWLMLRGYAGRRRGRTTVFLFPQDPNAERGRPAAVVKLRPLDSPRDDSDPPLAVERDALHSLVDRLPGELAATVPSVLGHGCSAGKEVLVLTALPGRAAYVEVRGALLPGRRTGTHFRAAAGWLARFHRATRSGPFVPPAPDELGLPEPVPPWYLRVGEAGAAGALRRVAGHGDFWARNLLVGGPRQRLPAVVDWEGFGPEAAPFDDLFHFPLTYGLAYPGPGYRPQSPLRAFERTFFGRGPLARAVGLYFRRYARDADLDPALLVPLFRLYLRLRTRDEEAPGSPGSRGKERDRRRLGGLPWESFERRLEGAIGRGGRSSVFSG